MAERRIHSIPLFKQQHMGSGSAGTTIDSDPIDLRDISARGEFSVSFTVGTCGGIASHGTTGLSYWVSQAYDGEYISPTGGTFGTCIANAAGGSAGTSNVVSISPPVAPFMKIRVVVGTSGTTKVSASLNVR